MSKKKHKKKNKHNKAKKPTPKVTPKATPKVEILPTKSIAEEKPAVVTDVTLEPSPECAEKCKKNRKINRGVRTAALCAAVILLLVGGALSFVAYTSRTLTVEVDGGYSAEASRNGSPFYTVEYSSVNVEKVGTYRNMLKFFGFMRRVQTVHVADTTAPEVTANKVSAVQGDLLVAEDFILSCRDSSAVKIAFTDGEPDTSVVGTQTVSVTVTDEFKNSSVISAELTVAPFNISAEVRSLCARLGETVDASQFIENISNPNMCTLSFGTDPDFTQVGIQDITVVIEDIFGSRTELTTKLFICDIPAELSFEYGVTAGEITDAVLDRVGRLADLFSLSLGEGLTQPGLHQIMMSNSIGTYTVAVIIKDTVAPVLVLQDMTVFVGDTLTIESLVVSCEELSEVTYTIENMPDTSLEGSYTVAVVATDASGNEARGEAVINVISDTEPPQIFGVKDITITKGSSVSLRSGVSAVDNRDGEVAVQVDSSTMNTSEPGTYPIYYTATDAAGNISTITAYLTVSNITTDTLNSLADGVLKYIVNDDMTQREKAWAIYTWCVNNIRYSTRTSYLMGNFVEGAYSGFTTRSGNCYIYYAVASTLLTRVGIENIEIQRDNPNSPHYWNLVNMGGEWYHFDTCPHFSGHSLQCFLLTDAEVREYSENEVEEYYSFDSSLYPATP